MRNEITWVRLGDGSIAKIGDWVMRSWDTAPHQISGIVWDEGDEDAEIEVHVLDDWSYASWWHKVPQHTVVSEGRKFDSGKPRPELIPPRAEEEVAKVLAGGAVKYDEDNWRKVENAKRRYIGAARRHILAHMKGDFIDPDYGAAHLAHAICSLMFVLELELEDRKIDEQSSA